MFGEVHLLAEVKSGSDASLRIFKRCDFALEGKNDGVERVRARNTMEILSATDVT